jgi:ribonuclease III, bacterial
MTTESTFENIGELESRLGINFQNKEYLKLALTHSSFAKRDPNIELPDNERLEFLGDAVLKLVSSELFYEAFPDLLEGTLTKYRSFIVSDKTLALIAHHFDIGDFLLFSYGEQKSGGPNKDSNLADCVEAILGAYYLDSGLEKSRELFMFLLTSVFPNWKNMSYFHDFKSKLQEWMQHEVSMVPHYDITDEKGPDHDKLFFVEVKLTYKSKQYCGKGKGKSIKDAEQDAAKSVLTQLGVLE